MNQVHDDQNIIQNMIHDKHGTGIRYQDNFENDEQFNKVEAQSDSCYESAVTCCGNFWGFLRTWLPCFCCWCPYPYVQIEQYEKGVVTHFGKYVGDLNPGFHFYNPCTQDVQRIDVRTKVLDLVKQVIISKDNITICMDASIYYSVNDPKKFLYRIDGVSALSIMGISSLRVVGAMYTLQQFLEQREIISENLEQYLIEHSKDWGVRVEQFFIKDIILSERMQTSLSSAAKQRKLAEAKIISAQADVQAAQMYRQAADLLATDAAMQIRYLEAIQGVSNTDNHKIVFMPLNDGNDYKK